MRYKVGDKVRVRKDLAVGKNYGGYVFARSMEEFKGKIVTIESVDCDCYFIKEDKFEFKYSWADEMLEPVITNWNKVEWISTKDRLPEEGTPVLIVRKLCNLKLMYVAYLDDDHWYDNYSGDLLDDFYNYPIIYWAELPELPQEE